MKSVLRFPPLNVPVPLRKAYHQRKQAHFDAGEYTGGWWTCILLVVVVASTLWSIWTAGKMPIGQVMLPSTLSLMLGVAAAKQRRLPPLLCHTLAFMMNLLIVSWQIWGACPSSQPLALVEHSCPGLVLVGGTGEAPFPIDFAMTLLGSVLAYASAWCVMRARWLWPLLVVHALVLLSMLAASEGEHISILMVFVSASLLLALQVHLEREVDQWDRTGVVYPLHFKQQMMRVGHLLSVGLVLLAWILPAGYVNPTVMHLWDEPSSVWDSLEDGWNQRFSDQQAFFADASPLGETLSLAGPPQLSPRVVVTVQSPTPGVYLESRWYDIYTGRGWTNGVTIPLLSHRQEALSAGTLLTHPLQQTVTIVAPLGGSGSYFLGAPGKTTISLPATVLVSPSDGEPVAWLAQRGPLVAGTHYSVTSSISLADAQQLRTVRLPAEAMALPGTPNAPLPALNYDPNEVTHFLQLPTDLDPRIARLAQQITVGAPTMYDKVVALESYLRTHYTYTTQVELPPGSEGVSWFLFESGHRGYCTYFATAMAILARSLGIPARLVTGYAPGVYDPGQQQQVIRGTDAHSWTQIYYASYGWINFEPTAGFSTLRHPLLNGGAITRDKSPVPHGVEMAGVLHRLVGTMLGGMVILLLILCLLSFLWWQCLWPRASRATHLYGRVCLLAICAGLGPDPWQTPGEYIQGLILVVPEAAGLLERLCDLSVREQWADPASPEHPQHSGELQGDLDLWKQLRPLLFWAVLRYCVAVESVPKIKGIFRHEQSDHSRRILDTGQGSEKPQEASPEPLPDTRVGDDWCQ